MVVCSMWLAFALTLAGSACAVCEGELTIENRSGVDVGIVMDGVPPDFTGDFYRRQGGWIIHPRNTRRLAENEILKTRPYPCIDPQRLAVTALSEEGDPVFQQIFEGDLDRVIVITDQRPLPVGEQLGTPVK